MSEARGILTLGSGSAIPLERTKVFFSLSRFWFRAYFLLSLHDIYSRPTQLHLVLVHTYIYSNPPPTLRPAPPVPVFRPRRRRNAEATQARTHARTHARTAPHRTAPQPRQKAIQRSPCTRTRACLPLPSAIHQNVSRLKHPHPPDWLALPGTDPYISSSPHPTPAPIHPPTYLVKKKKKISASFTISHCFELFQPLPRPSFSPTLFLFLRQELQELEELETAPF
ncbi:hypothetical protein DFH27DRAFT_322343 [Peziza echinospora]|nr:hypothetical protein DFH27DRAFT_322343 [Peziza echinospora]